MDLRVPGVTIAVTAAAVALVVTTRAHGSTPRDPLQGAASTAQQANSRARVMLDRAYQLGAVRLPTPATYTSLPFREHEVEQSRWLSTPGSPADIVEVIAAHPPAGFVVTATNRLTRATDEAYYGQTIELKPNGQRNSSLHVLDVTAFPATAVRSTVLLQATVGWVPPRTAAERIPENTASATMDLGLGAAPGLFRRIDLSAAQTRHMASLVNRLPSTTDDQYDSCPGPVFGVAVIEVPATQAQYRVELGGCHQVQVAVGGLHPPTLLGDDGFDLEITGLVGTTPSGG